MYTTSRRWRPDGRRLDEPNDYKHRFLMGLRILPRWRAVQDVSLTVLKLNLQFVAEKLCHDSTKYFVFDVTDLM